ncbi:DUF2142 domain-containing protein [Schaalia sp. ZJ1691]|uniref:DUF2142 domain-containing protein n=1 Tax=Schaalia sp. ZJ1691 TaxID=2709404 RepID=UPI0013EA625D|nr:DUF2142 domain-containing protein [Schaalia sp. ZJ1691]
MSTKNSFVKNRNFSWITGGLLLLCILVIGAGWAISSPVGGSPDDDFHLTSIWCPKGEDSCPSRIVDGVMTVGVPQPVYATPGCFAGVPTLSAACSSHVDPNLTVWTPRYNTGQYPGAYYAFHHLFITDNISASVITMRLINVLIAAILMSAIVVLMPKKYLPPLLIALIGSWIPLGMYLISTNNPSSWSITGVFTYTVAMLMSARTQGLRRWILLALATIGAALCFASRPDASFYIFVVSMGLLFAIRWNRTLRINGIALAVLSILGVFNMFVVAQSNNLSAGTPQENTSLLNVLARVPSLFGGFYSHGQTLGWLDIPINASAVFLFLVAAGATLMLGLRGGSWHKWMASLMVAGALCGIPIVFGTIGAFPGLSGYQARYILPLLAPLLWMLYAADRPRQQLVSLPQFVLIASAFTAGHAMQLHAVITRYVRGLGETNILNIDSTIEWWWNIPVSPMTLWLCVSAVFAVAIACAGILIFRFQDPKLAHAEHTTDSLSDTSR